MRVRRIGEWCIGELTEEEKGLYFFYTHECNGRCHLVTNGFKKAAQRRREKISG